MIFLKTSVLNLDFIFSYFFKLKLIFYIINLINYKFKEQILSIYIKKSIGLFTILSSILVINACMPRQADGKYYSAYSYHPYTEVKIIKKHTPIERYSTHSEMIQSYKKPPKIQTHTEDNPPSNVPRNSIL